MKILSVMLTDTVVKAHLRKLCNVILRALIASNKFEIQPRYNGAALAEDKTQSLAPASCNGKDDFAKQSCRTVEMNQLTSEGLTMTYSEHVTDLPETYYCDRKGQCSSISHLN